jgi:hypothetical protein
MPSPHRSVADANDLRRRSPADLLRHRFHGIGIKSVRMHAGVISLRTMEKIDSGGPGLVSKHESKEAADSGEWP